MPTRAEIRVALERLSTPELLTTLSSVVSTSYTGEALEIVRELLAERGVDPENTQAPPPRPGCGHPLDVEAGDLEPRSGWIGLLLAGIGYQPTWFTSRTTGRREIVLLPGHPKRAVRCTRCGLVMFGGRL